MTGGNFGVVILQKVNLGGGSSLCKEAWGLPPPLFGRLLLPRSVDIRIFYAFLVVVVGVILFMLPVSEAVYDFRTDLREDEFDVTTGVGVTTTNVTLLREVYDDDTETIDILSDDSDDSPVFGSYDSTSHSVNITGLSGNLTRTLTVSYDVDALEGSEALDTFVGYVPWIWLLIIIVFPIAALAAIFTGRAD